MSQHMSTVKKMGLLLSGISAGMLGYAGYFWLSTLLASLSIVAVILLFPSTDKRQLSIKATERSAKERVGFVTS